jgi:hypothetical protein
LRLRSQKERAQILSLPGEAREGVVADKSSQLIVDALRRAVANPDGMPLHSSKRAPGLFAANAGARQAAQRCKDDGLLRVVHSQTSGKSVQEICAISEKGLSYLLSEISPKQVLEELVHTLEAREVQVGELVAAARQWQAGLDTLQATVQKVLLELQKPGQPLALWNVVPGLGTSRNGSETWITTAIAYLKDWQDTGQSSDCPLPDLYRQVQGTTPDLTIGRFHDGLRRLHDQQKIYLHPWTGPLYEIPEPPYALLIGHEIVYYVSLRNSSVRESAAPARSAREALAGASGWCASAR